MSRVCAGWHRICRIALPMLLPWQLVLSVHPALAQTEDAAPRAQETEFEALPPGYEQAVDRAVDEHERGHFAEAREHFRTAHQIFPNARTLRGLGKVEFELRNYGESLKFLTEALASTVRPLSPELREEVRALLARAQAYVGEVHVDVQPGSATVSVDGVTVATGPQAALALQVGDHLLEFRAAGRLPERRQIRVHGGDQINIQVVLPSPEFVQVTKPLPSETPRRDTRTYQKWWLWAGVGTIVTGAAIAAAVVATRSAPQTPPSGGTAGVTLRSP